MRDRDSELLNIPGVGPQTRQRLLTHFGSLRDVQQATAESLSAVVARKTAETICVISTKPSPRPELSLLSRRILRFQLVLRTNAPCPIFSVILSKAQRSRRTCNCNSGERVGKQAPHLSGFSSPKSRVPSPCPTAGLQIIIHPVAQWNWREMHPHGNRSVQVDATIRNSSAEQNSIEYSYLLLHAKIRTQAI